MSAPSLNIALFSDSALPILNGVSVSIDALVKGLRDRGHSVHLFTSAYPGHAEMDPNVHRMFAAHTFFAKDYPLALPPFYPMLREFRKHRFDLIHTHTPFTVGFVGLRWAESHEIPLVTTYHTHYDKYTHYIPLFPKKFLRYKIAKHTNYYYNRCSHIFTPSDASARWLRRHRVIQPISVVPTGIRPALEIDQSKTRELLGAKPEQRIALYVGRVAGEKNLETTIMGTAQAMLDDPRLCLWVVGDGPDRERYRKLASDLGIGDRTKFFGAVPRDEVDKYYAAADVFVFSSMTETQGLVVSEAMSYGLPAVVVRGGGASESTVNGLNGLVVPNDPGEFGGAVRTVLGSEQVYNGMSQNAMESSKALSTSAMVDKILAGYRACLDARITVPERFSVR